VIELIGEIRTGVNAYYDQYQEDQKFLIGYSEGVLIFILGNSKDISLYIKALENYDKKSNQVL